MPTHATSVARVVEKYYSPRELSCLIGFDERFWRQRAKDGEFTLTIDADPDGPPTVVCQPLEIAGELRIPATAVNAFLVKHPYRYDAGVKARNAGELRRRLSRTKRPEATGLP